MAGQRLQKIIAHAGITSRRKAEALVLEGRVAVNGVTVSELGATADPGEDLITLDGRPLQAETLRYFIVNKPSGFLCAVQDERGRPVVVDLLPEGVEERLYPAGRLDLDSEGLVLLTNDGELMQAVTRPGGGIDKAYEVVVGGGPRDEDLSRLRAGPELEGRRLLPCEIDVLERVDGTPTAASEGRARGFTRLRVTLHEGKKNQIRRMFRDAGHRVERLVRRSIGPVELGDLKEGRARELSPEEVAALRSGASSS